MNNPKYSVPFFDPSWHWQLIASENLSKINKEGRLKNYRKKTIEFQFSN